MDRVLLREVALKSIFRLEKKKSKQKAEKYAIHLLSGVKKIEHIFSLHSHIFTIISCRTKSDTCAIPLRKKKTKD